MNTNGQQSNTSWLLDQSRRRSDGKIGHETESLHEKTDSALKSILRNASEIRRPARCTAEERAPWKCRRQQAWFRRIRSRRL